MAERRTDEGFSLLEVLISVAILGVVIVALVGSMGTSLIASRTHRRQADTGALLQQAAEKVKSPSTPYIACATPTEPAYVSAARSVSPMPALGPTTQWNPATTVSLTSVTYWNGTAFTATCNDNITDVLGNPFTLLRIQLITVKVTSPDGSAAQELTIAKRG